MPNHPYPTHPPITDPETVECWRVYEALARRAHRQYLASPIAYYGRAFFDTCWSCGTPTENVRGLGLCARCGP